MSDKEIDHSHTDEIVCPYCGYEYGDSWELNQENGTEQTCPDCGETFMLSVNVEITYSTEKANTRDKFEVKK